jgi:hypothetical protein
MRRVSADIRVGGGHETMGIDAARAHVTGEIVVARDGMEL